MVARRVAAVEVPFSNLSLTDKLGGHRWARLAGDSSKGSKAWPAVLTEHQQRRTDKAAMHAMVLWHDNSCQSGGKRFRIACNCCNA